MEKIRKVDFPIVGIGASAGGLAAIEAFFTAIPEDKKVGMAFVVVQHLDPDHKSVLADLVQHYTAMPVILVTDNMEVEIDSVYIIPPNYDMAFTNGRLNLLQPKEPRGHRMAIDFFFRSLAEDQKERSIGIILSGTGADGTYGLQAIAGEGGIGIVQTLESAEYDAMPRSVISMGLATYILHPAKMVEQLIIYVRQMATKESTINKDLSQNAVEAMAKVFLQIKSQTGHDFSLYKKNTTQRRIERRMIITKKTTIEEYALYLRENKAEVNILFQELLIRVTNFFRDPEAFNSLQTNVISHLFDKPEGTIIRIWVAGCSTGEEAYSVSILIKETLETLKKEYEVQVFATDIDADAIEKARTGIYPESIAADISPERLVRYFNKEPNYYRVNKTIRDIVVFAKHDLLKDPPFSKMDLITCRNMLIYFNAEAQKKVFPLFHNSINADGALFLGNSESIGNFTNLFDNIDNKWKIYRRKNVIVTRNTAVHLSSGFTPETPTQKPLLAISKRKSLRNVAEEALLEAYVPAWLLINKDFDLLYMHGNAGRFLEMASGEASVNILRMTNGQLRVEIAAAIRKAVSQNSPVRQNGIIFQTNGESVQVNLIVQPITKPEEATSMLLVIFENTLTSKIVISDIAESSKGSNETEQRIIAIEQELQSKSEFLQSTIEELETTNEELQSSNEELQSANEELQSTNEEMETSKEELQSVNEELLTVNAELQKKMEELSRSNNDMNNLMAGTNIGTLFVDHQLRIVRFTPATVKIINLIPSDLGRPVSDIVSRLLNYDRLIADVQSVLDTLIPKEIEVQNKEGEWYQMRIQPYRTMENHIEGAVITFVEVTALKKAEKQLRLAVVVHDSNDAIIMYSLEGKILAWNPGAERTYGWSEVEALKMNIQDIIPEEERKASLESMKKLSDDGKIEPIQTTRISKNGSVKKVWLIASILTNKTGEHYAIATTEREIL